MNDERPIVQIVRPSVKDIAFGVFFGSLPALGLCMFIAYMVLQDAGVLP
jgi:hypothetical protein